MSKVGIANVIVLLVAAVSTIAGAVYLILMAWVATAGENLIIWSVISALLLAAWVITTLCRNRARFP